MNRVLQLRFSLFGLPVALSGALLPYLHGTPSIPWSLWFWIVAAFMGARGAGMALNHLIDAKFDARNPRTQDRPLASGAMSRRMALLLIVACHLLFFFSCWMIQPLLALLALPAAGLILLYSYTKRFTPLCHLVLGLIQALAPIYAFIAVTGRLELGPVLLGGALLCWITAHDIVYALQDRLFDLQEGLQSIPARLGERRAIQLVGGLQTLAVLLLAALGWIDSMPLVYAASVVLLALHFLFWGRRPIFWSNAIASAMVWLGIGGGVVWQRWF